MTGTIGPSALWYLTRGTGAVTLILLTISVALGVANVRRAHTEHVPRFVVDAVHRSASLLALTFLAVHVLTAVLDPFAPIGLIDAVVPFISSYRPVWLGLGTVAADLLIAVALTSMMRRRIGHRVWRTTHWLAYACWPVALVHGLGTGSDAKTGWMLGLTAASILTVLSAVWIRVRASGGERVSARASAAAASVAFMVGLFVWLPTGPLASGWAIRAGTPGSLLANTAAHGAGTTTAIPNGVRAPTSFAATATGTVTESQPDSGLTRINLRLTLDRSALTVLSIQIEGQALTGGGVAMTASSVTLGTASSPDVYSGQVTSLAGTSIEASVSGTRGSLRLRARLRIDPSTGGVTGNVTARPGP